jgi:hypothetical protein
MEARAGKAIYSEMTNPEIIDTLQRRPGDQYEPEEQNMSEAQLQPDVEERKWLWAFPQIEGVPP